MTDPTNSLALHCSAHHIRRGGARVAVLWIITGLIALAAGVRFSDAIRMRLGLSKPHSDLPAASAAKNHLWTCGMHPQVIQNTPGDCPICHMELTPLKVNDAGASHGVRTSQDGSPSMTSGGMTDQRHVMYWWDPMMNPPYISDKPGQSPMGMQLVPVYEDVNTSGGAPGDGHGGAITIDPVVVQNMGLRTARVSEEPLKRAIRVVGYLDEAQPNIRDINLRVSGWIVRLYADIEGMHVQAGDPLFELYSPELRVAVEELIAARRALNVFDSASDEQSRKSSQSLYDATVQKLELWDLPRSQIEALSKLDRAPETLTFVSPIAGHVTEKPIVEGAAVKAGDRVLRIVDHSTLWLDAQVFEKDLPFVSLGQTADATIVSRPGAMIAGEVVFVHPHVDPRTRTALIRLALPNPDLSLRPGMYATVRLQSELSPRAVMVPREAIIDTGERQLAFVATAVGRFQPRWLKVGLAGDNGMVQVIEGLSPNENVVVSGQFLLDSESRLREAILKYLDQKQDVAAAHQPSATPQVISHIDAVVNAYLSLVNALGQVQVGDSPLDAKPLAAASRELRDSLRGESAESLAASIAAAGDTLEGQTLDQQRESFKAVSDALIALIEWHAPSTDVGERLHVMYCPMAPGHWVQVIERINNPYYADSMKQCGEIVRTLVTARKDAANP